MNCQQHTFTKQMLYLKHFSFSEVFPSEGMDSGPLIPPPLPPVS